TGDIAMGLADLLPLALPQDFAADGTGGILDHRDGVSLPDCNYGREVAGHAELVNAEDRPGARRDCRLDQIGIDVVAIRLDVDEDGNSPTVADRIRGRDEGVTDGDDLVAGLHADSAQGEMQ